MSDPLVSPAVAAAIKFGPSVIGTIGGLFKGKGREAKLRDKALSQLEALLDGDTSALQPLIDIISSQDETAARQVVEQARASGLDPSSGIVQDAKGAIERRTPKKIGAAVNAITSQKGSIIDSILGGTSGTVGTDGGNVADTLGSLIAGVGTDLGIDSRSPLQELFLSGRNVSDTIPAAPAARVGNIPAPRIRNPRLRKLNPINRIVG